MMTPERLQQVEELYHAALEREPQRRAAFLEEACAGDQALRGEVESLISAHQQEGSFIDSPAYEGAAEALAGNESTIVMSANHQSDPVVGRRIGPYKIVREIGRGGMGEVYLAQDTRLPRKVALKLLRADFTKDEQLVRRFQQEACAASALNHPNIVTIYEVGKTDGTRFIATEYIEGETLRSTMSNSKMEVRDVLEVATQVASALTAAHQAGIVHRDIKPENIMLRPDGYVKVLDFGLAKLTEQQVPDLDSQASTVVKVETEHGMRLGTVKYMSPEQARGVAVDSRSDVFSLGIVIYEMVAGRCPFEGKTAADVFVSILTLEPPPLASHSPETPNSLQEIVSKALRKDREERYQTATELALDTERLKQAIDFERQGRQGSEKDNSAKQTVENSVISFAELAIDARNKYWTGGRTLRFTKPYPHTYPFESDCKFEFHLCKDVVGADPSFDITVMNIGSKPVLLTSIGFEIVSVGFLAPGPPKIGAAILGALPKAVKVKKQDNHTITVPDIWGLLPLNDKWVEWNARWSSVAERSMDDWIASLDHYGEEDPPAAKSISIDLAQIVSIRLPEPIYIQSEAPYRYGLLLTGYHIHMPTHAILRMWMLTSSGESRSEEIYIQGMFYDWRSKPKENADESRSKEGSTFWSKGSVWFAAGLALVLGFLFWYLAIRPLKVHESVERSLRYSLEVQKYRDGKPFQNPFRLAGEMNFEKDYRVRLNVSSPQPGYLYILNEGPELQSKAPDFNVLFPSPTANAGSAFLAENQQVQIPEQSWFQFDEQQGTERVWLVLTGQTVPELEAVKASANPNDKGLVRDPTLNIAVKEFLRTHTVGTPIVEKDDDKKETTIKAHSDIVAHAIKLEHH